MSALIAAAAEGAARRLPCDNNRETMRSSASDHHWRSAMEWNIVTQRDVDAAVRRLTVDQAAAPEEVGPDPVDAGGQSAGADINRPAGGRAPGAPAGTPEPDDFWNRLMKGIPLAVIGGYLATTDILNSVTDDGSQRAREIVFWLVFLFFTIMTPLFARRILKVKRRRQLALSTAAFVIWAFALGGPFDISFDWWAPWMGGIAVICSALMLMVIEPAGEADELVPVLVPV